MIAFKWCRTCDKHYARCKCETPDFYAVHQGKEIQASWRLDRQAPDPKRSSPNIPEHGEKMGVVLTRAAKKAWDIFCGDRPGEELPLLIDVMKNAREIERPENLTGDHLLAYQHPEFRSIFFVVTINEDMEEVVIGIRFVRQNRKAKATQNKEHKPQPEHGVIEWDKQPSGLSDKEILDWCAIQTSIAHGRIASGECNKSQCNARIMEVALVKKLVNQRMAKPPLDPLRKVKKRDDFERGQDRERGDIINFIKEIYPNSGWLVQKILNGDHRKPLKT